MDTRWTFFNLAADGQTPESSLHKVVNSPVAELHLSEKSVKGMRISEKSFPAGTVKGALKHPRPRKVDPPVAHARVGLMVEAANDTLYPA